MTHVTCRLTAKNRDHLRNPTLGNRVWATFFYLFFKQLHVIINTSIMVVCVNMEIQVLICLMYMMVIK